MSASSRLLALLAFCPFLLALDRTPTFADADVVAGRTYKCLDTCGAPDGICDDGELRASGCELGTADCGPRLIVLSYVLVPATRYTISCFPVERTIKIDPWDALANLSGDTNEINDDSNDIINDMSEYLRRHWPAVWLGLQSYLRCFEPDCTVGLTWKLPRPDVTMYEAVVTDKTGNGSSAATLERAAALSQESKAGLFKALAMVVEGSVTVSAPRMVMEVQASPLALARPQPTAPPAETEAKAAGLAMAPSVCDDCNGYGAYGAAEEGSDRDAAFFSFLFFLFGVGVVIVGITTIIICSRRWCVVDRRQRDVAVHRETWLCTDETPWAQPMPAKVEVATVVVIAIVKQDADLRV